MSFRYLQMVNSDLFQMYDYGSSDKNQAHYNVVSDVAMVT